LPSVNALYDRYKARGLEVRLIAFREPPDLVRKTVEARRYTAPVLVDESGDTTGRDYGVFAPPTAYLIDRSGDLLGRVVGPRAWNGETARRLIEQLLAAPARK
jgi:AhpC/TSA family protein